MTTALIVIWFTAAIVGALAAVVAIVSAPRRKRALLVAGSGFAVAGVLGILSIGIFFLLLSAICFAAAIRRPAEPI